ncbi:MAG: xylulokinase [Acidimicrobiales bacterium]
MTGSYALGVDSSTGATKVEIVDIASGHLVATSRTPHPATTPPVSEQDPETWWRALLTCLEAVTDHLPSVGAIGISGQQHGLVALDRDDCPVRPAKLWNDTTSAAESEGLIARLGPDVWASAAGSVPGPSFTVTKLAWLQGHEPEHYRNVRRVGLPHDYLNLRISGRWTTDRGDASGTGYWSPSQGRYLPELLADADINVDDIEFPRVANPFEAIGSISSSRLLELGLDSNCLVAPGSGDNMCAALGLGVAPDDLVVSLGTSGTAYAVSNVSTSDAKGFVAGFADASGRFLPLVCTLNATKVTESVRALLGVDHAEFDTLALNSSQGANGLTLVPYFDGERTPNLPDASGSLLGIRNPLERTDLARAAVEGVTCGLLDGVDALLDNGVTARGRFFLIGGGARSESFAQVFACLSTRAVLIPENGETVARGAAVQAACVLGGESPSDIASRWKLDAGRVVEPAPCDGESATEVRARFREAAQASRPIK